MSSQIQAVRGMNDVLPVDVQGWQYLENKLASLARRYGYQEIRFPILEKTELFSRSVGEVTDIVEKEMFSFVDRNGDHLCLRPEGTASCVRAAIEHGLLHHQIQKLWYCGPLFRHERPQKGRYRQFHQFALEAFGISSIDIEIEMILFCARLWAELGLDQLVKLELNTLGSPEERKAYRNLLVEYFRKSISELDEDSKRRLDTNPLRILDSKNPLMQSLISSAPRLLDHLGSESAERFSRLRQLLDVCGVQYEINTRLVRGLDYYSHTVFEWTTDRLGAQATICAGGRYDGLVEDLGGQATPAFGFAAGLERLLLLLKEVSLFPSHRELANVFIIALGDTAKQQAVLLAESLRERLPFCSVVMSMTETGLKSQMKKADQSGATFALIIGENEAAEKKVSVKYLREERPQLLLNFEECISLISGIAV